MHNLEELVRNECTNDVLSFISDADYNAVQNDILENVKAGSGKWFLQSTEFKLWLAGQSETLYCYGPPGAGKTTMTALAVNEVRKMHQHDEDVGIAFIYLDEDDSGENFGDWKMHILSSILRQFSEPVTDLTEAWSLSLFQDRHKKHDTKPTIEEIIEELNIAMCEFSKTFIFIDSLDCLSAMLNPGCPDDLVNELMTLQDEFGTNIFFNSRPTPAVVNCLASFSSIEIRADPDDVRQFLESEMSKLPGFIRRSPKYQDEVIKNILENAQGM
jgi:Cdc6-like AAA superfamily ATPase